MSLVLTTGLPTCTRPQERPCPAPLTPLPRPQPEGIRVLCHLPSVHSKCPSGCGRQRGMTEIISRLCTLSTVCSPELTHTREAVSPTPPLSNGGSRRRRGTPRGLAAPCRRKGCRTRCLPFHLSPMPPSQDLGPSLGGLGQETIWGPPDKRLSSGVKCLTGRLSWSEPRRGLAGWSSAKLGCDLQAASIG